ncbi:MAG: hypothetical protein QNL04_08700 [SAR324 cluster bacterium]|nr:hypothetical protein [SAR324 cluster bacterium]
MSNCHPNFRSSHDAGVTCLKLNNGNKCLFHKEKSDNEVEGFNKALKGLITKAIKNDQELDLSNFSFPAGTEKVFDGKVFTQHVNFTGARLLADYPFKDVVFLEGVSFVECKIEELMFDYCVIKKTLNFGAERGTDKNSQIGRLHCYHCQIEKGDFSGVEFLIGVVLDTISGLDTGVGTVLAFNDAKFSLGNASELQIKFSEILELALGDIQVEKIDLTDCSIHSLYSATMVGEKSNMSINFTNFQYLVISKGISYINLNYFLGAKLSFFNCDMSHIDLLGHNLADGEQVVLQACTWKNVQQSNDYSQVIHHEIHIGSGRIQLLNTLYTQLKKRYDDAGNSAQSGDFHYWEMETRRKYVESLIPWRKRIFSSEWVFLTLYKCIADYGESYKKLFVWAIGWFSLGVIVVSALESFRPLKGLGLYLRQNWAIPFTTFKSTVSSIFPPGVGRAFVQHNLNFTGAFVFSFFFYGFLAILALFLMAVRRKFKR